MSSMEWSVCLFSSQSCLRPYVRLANLSVAVTDSTLPLQASTLYIVRVRATNAVGLRAAFDSPPFLVDLDTPRPGVVRGRAGGFMGNGTALVFSWSGFSDAVAVQGYGYCVQLASEAPQTCSVLPASSTQSKTASLGPASALPLVNGRAYLFHVWAWDYANRSSAAASTLFVLDNVPPTPGTVLDGGDSALCLNAASAGPAANVDVAVQTSTTTMAVVWTGFADVGGRIASYLVAVGTAPGRGDVFAPQPFASMAQCCVVPINVSGLPQQPVTLFATVTAVDQAGNQASNSSSGVLVVAPQSGAQAAQLQVTGTFNGFVRAQTDVVTVRWQTSA